MSTGKTAFVEVDVRAVMEENIDNELVFNATIGFPRAGTAER